MQRKLFLCRHGKSSWESIVNDIDRPLNERGVKNSYEMATRLVDAGLIPEVIYSSPAIRALHTAVIMSKVWEMQDHNIHIWNNLYLADIEQITQLICEIPDTYSSVALFGHNPGFTHFVNRYMDKSIENLPTAGIAVLTLELDSWNTIFNSRVEDVAVDYPKK
jgi:phosphohistidine phosphatase